MWYVILSAIIIVVALIVLFVATIDSGWDKWFTRGMGSFLILFGGGFVLFGIALPVLGFTSGLMLDYSSGERQGYVTKFSQKGIIFKTFEGQIQIGTGQMAALQEPWQFSVPPDMANDVQNLLGERVRVEYDEALILPFRLGGTSYLITNIEKIDMRASE